MSWIGALKGAGLVTDYVQAPYEVYKTYRQYRELTDKYPDIWKYRAGKGGSLHVNPWTGQETYRRRSHKTSYQRRYRRYRRYR